MAVANVRSSLPESCLVMEAGYVASEMQGTINIDPPSNTCLPALDDTFFEFAERDAWEAGAAELLSMSELETERDYYVVVTTPDGLYRYDMSDIVRVTGWVGSTPSLVFVQKGSGITSITGEKLHEAQVLDAVPEALREHGLTADFFIVLADVDAACYTLYAEVTPAPSNRSEGQARSPAREADSHRAVAAEADARLGAMNIEYSAKRSSGRLGPMVLRRLRPGTGRGVPACTGGRPARGTPSSSTCTSSTDTTAPSTSTPSSNRIARTEDLVCESSGSTCSPSACPSARCSATHPRVAGERAT